MIFRFCHPASEKQRFPLLHNLYVWLWASTTFKDQPFLKPNQFLKKLVSSTCHHQILLNNYTEIGLKSQKKKYIKISWWKKLMFNDVGTLNSAFAKSLCGISAVSFLIMVVCRRLWLFHICMSVCSKSKENSVRARFLPKNKTPDCRVWIWT